MVAEDEVSELLAREQVAPLDAVGPFLLPGDRGRERVARLQLGLDEVAQERPELRQTDTAPDVQRRTRQTHALDELGPVEHPLAEHDVGRCDPVPFLIDDVAVGRVGDD